MIESWTLTQRAQQGGPAIQDQTIVDVATWYGDVVSLGEAITKKVFSNGSDGRRIREGATETDYNGSLRGDPEALAIVICRMAAFFVFLDEARQRSKNAAS